MAPQPSLRDIIDKHEWESQYRVLSELYVPNSKHKTQQKIGKMMDDILKKIEDYKKKFG